MKDYYNILGVTPQDTQDRIKKVYNHLVKIYHPDIGGGKSGEEKIKEINEAYEILSDPGKRAIYNVDWRRVYGSDSKHTRANTNRKQRPTADTDFTSSQRQQYHQEPPRQSQSDSSQERQTKDYRQAGQGFGEYHKKYQEKEVWEDRSSQGQQKPASHVTRDVTGDLQSIFVFAVLSYIPSVVLGFFPSVVVAEKFTGFHATITCLFLSIFVGTWLTGVITCCIVVISKKRWPVFASPLIYFIVMSIFTK